MSRAVALASGMEARKGEDQRSGASAQPTARSRRETPDRRRPIPDLPGLHPCPRDGGALSSQTEKGRLCRSEAKASRQSRDRLKRHPQEGQHSAASWRDPGPSASGERHRFSREGSKPIGRDASRLGSREPDRRSRTRNVTPIINSPVNSGRQYRVAGQDARRLSLTVPSGPTHSHQDIPR